MGCGPAPAGVPGPRKLEPMGGTWWSGFALLGRYGTLRRYWLAGMASEVGDVMAWVALPWLVLRSTGSGPAAAGVLLALELPAVASGVLLGALSDRFQPRAIMVLDNVGRMAIFVALAALYLAGSLPLWLLFALVGLAGALQPATLVGGRVLLPELVADEDLDAANMLVSLGVSLSVVVGPAVAGLLLAAVGGPIVLALDALTFVAMAIVASTLPRVERAPSSRAPSGPPSFAERFGWRQIWDSPIVRVTTLLSLVFFFSYGPLEAAMPVFSARVLGTDAGGFGLLWAALGVGMLVGTAMSVTVGRRVRVGVALAGIAVLWGACLLPLLVVRQVGWAACFLALGGLVWGPYVPLETTLLQRNVPRSELGRVFGARTTLLTSGAPLGIAVGGAMLTFLPSTVLIGLSGLACVAVGAVGLGSRALRRARSSPAADGEALPG